MKARVALGAVAAGALLAMAACSSGSPADEVQPESPAAPAPSIAPSQFDAAAAVPLPAEADELNTALHKTTAFINTPAGVIVFDTTAGKTQRVITAPHPADTGDATRTYRPVTGTVDGTDVMLIMVQVAGQGTAPDKQAFDILIIDASTGTLTRTVTTQVNRPDAGRLPARAVAIIGGDLIVNNMGRTSRIGLADGTQRWEAPSIETVVATGAGTGSRLLGAAYLNGEIHLRALDADTGQTVWTDPAGAGMQISINAAGPRYVVAASQNYTKVVDVNNGATIASRPAPVAGGMRCFYDAQAITVCSAAGTWTSAVDSTTGQWLWEWPEATSGGSPATISAALLGRAYGTTASGPVIIDARSGQTVESPAATAPILVNEYGALAKSGDRLAAYPVKR